MEAELSQLLARAQYSAWWREWGPTLAGSRDWDPEDLLEQLVSESIKAYSRLNLPPDIKNFLDMCDRSLEVQRKLFPEDDPDMPQARLDKAVLDALTVGGAA